MVRPVPALAFLASLLVGCVAAPSVPPPPPIPDGPDIGSARSVHIEQITEEAADYVTSDGSLGTYFAVGEELFFLDPISGLSLSMGSEAGAVAGLTQLSGGESLVSGTAGLFVLTEAGLALSPLTELLPDLGAARLYSTADEDLWIVSNDELLLWRAGTVYDLQPVGLPVADSEVLLGELDGETALWVASGDAIYALVEDSGGFTAHPRAGDFEATGLALDSYDTLWASSGGGLWGRWPDGTEEVLDLPFASLDVHSNARSGELWISTDQGLWLHETGTFQPIDNAPTGSLLAVDSVGRALLSSEDGLFRLSAGRPLLFLGIVDGTELSESASLHLLPTVTEDFSGVTATLDGVALPLDSVDGFSVVLDPDLLSDGAHELAAVATYGEGDEVTASLYFSVGEFVPPTWSADIEPLFVADCALCHSATSGATSAGGGHPMDSLAAWQTEIDDILDAVLNERMPLNDDPWSEEKISLLEDWRAGGFLE